MKHNLFSLSLLVLWLLSYIFYPLWYLPQEELRGISFIILLVFFVLNFFLIDRFIKVIPHTLHPPISIRKEKIIWWSGLIYFLLEIYPITMPVLPRSDEEHYLTSSLSYYLKISTLWERSLKVPWMLCVWGLLLFCIFITVRKSYWRLFKRKRYFVTLVIAAGIVYYIYFARYSSLKSFFYLFHYPLFSKFFYIVTYSLFGGYEFGPRIIQTVFGFLSGIYLYKLVLLYRSRIDAVFSFIIWLFMPACIFFGNLALLVNGISFFFISSFYYLLRFQNIRDHRDLFCGVFLLCAGVMYQQPVIFAWLIWSGYLLIQFISKNLSFHKDRYIFILPAWAVIVTVMPYLIITRFIYVPFEGYTFSIGELFSKSAYTEQVRLSLSGLSFFHIVFLLAGLISTIKRRDMFSLFIFIWFIGYFSFQIVYPYTGVFRLLIPYFPVLAIWIGIGISATGIKRYGIVAVLIYAILTSTIWAVSPLSTDLMLYRKITSRYLPYPEAILYLKRNLYNMRCLSPGHSSPEKFYSLRFRLPISSIDHTVWEKVVSQNGDNLYEYSKSHNIKFCLFPSGDWAKGFLNFSLRDKLVSGADKRFSLRETFSFGENKLYLLEVK